MVSVAAIIVVWCRWQPWYRCVFGGVGCSHNSGVLFVVSVAAMIVVSVAAIIVLCCLWCQWQP